MSVYSVNQRDKDLAQKAALIKQGSLMFCRYQGDHKKACVGARETHKIRERFKQGSEQTFVEVKVLRRTAIVCSCADTSSIVFGRLYCFF